MTRASKISRGSDPTWYKHATIYQLHVRSFFDSNADGIGDFPGLTQKLDYLQDLGVSAVWLLPFYPSPLRDDGYDIADYYNVNPIYGTIDQFKKFLDEAHRRNLRVITELVINHTSDQNPWFQRARRSPPGSNHRNYYVWSDNPKKYKEARIIFRDFEPSNWTWDPVAQAYYWHRFYFHQPDLNFDNLDVHQEILKILDYWLDMGVDGLRLDAIPYLYEREGTSCENLPETHAYLKTLRKHVDERYGDRMLLAEANQWPEDSVTYLGEGKGDECHMAFHFPVMPRLFMSVRMEDRLPIIDILEQTPAIPETSQWAIFLRNHDELTLEMVTDEERDYMYRVYASDIRARINLGIRRRLAPLLNNDRRKIELLNLLLFSLPGTPVIYYGDEIGMGDNIFLGDRNGVRTPMHWNSDKNAGFSKANPHALFFPVIVDPEYHYETTNVEAQKGNPNSLLWWVRRVLALRKRWRAFGEGTIEFLQPDNRKVLVFLRKTGDENILVVANLSRFAQPVELDLAQFNRYIPFELFGRTPFPAISDAPYPLTLAPYALFWFHLKPSAAILAGESHSTLPMIGITGDWNDLLAQDNLSQLESILPEYIQQRRWFGGKSKAIASALIREVIPMGTGEEWAALLLITMDYHDADPDDYVLPVSYATGEEADQICDLYPHFMIARVENEVTGDGGFLCDATARQSFARNLLAAVSENKVFTGIKGSLQGTKTFLFPAQEQLNITKISIGKAEQSNSAILYDDRFFLKIFRKTETGQNPDYEVGRFLTERAFKNTPAVYGVLEYGQEPTTEKNSIAIITEVIADAKNGWEYALDALGRFFERAVPHDPRHHSPPPPGFYRDKNAVIPDATVHVLGAFQESARLLGKRTGEMHLALGADSETKAFAPEAYVPFSQRSLYQSLRNAALQNLQLLKRKTPSLPAALQETARRVTDAEKQLMTAFRRVYSQPDAGMRNRCHGAYHLGQVLFTGRDFFIIDFEGEPARPLSERKIKRSPLRDVAGMLRSFHYASHAGVHQEFAFGKAQLENPHNQLWAELWTQWISAIYLQGYFEAAGESELLPGTVEGFEGLLHSFILEKALYEIGYELNNRPDWVRIPLQGALKIIENDALLHE
jgi:maltose alpha-D-glucosyltransferase/alpha-amylase